MIDVGYVDFALLVVIAVACVMCAIELFVLLGVVEREIVRKKKEKVNGSERSSIDLHG